MRRMKAAVVAVILASALIRTMDINLNLCATLDPGGWLYALLGCDNAPGGGGSGAGD